MKPLLIACNERRRDMLSAKSVCTTVLMVFFIFATTSRLPAQLKDPSEGPFNLEAGSIAYDMDQDTFLASGNVLITFSGGTLKADRVTLKRRDNLAFAEGHVELRSDQDQLAGEKITFDLVTKNGIVNDGRMFIARNHLYITGEKIEKKGDVVYRLENVTVTTCDGETPDWKLAGSELDLTVDGYGTLKHGRFLARDVPLLYVPYLIFPAKTTRQSGFLMPRFAYSRDRNGLDVELPFYWAASDSTDATFFQRYMEKRGFKEGVEFRYYPSQESFGTFYGDVIYDRKRVVETIGNESRDWQEDRSRWSYYFNHETSSASGFSIRSDIRRVSDHWYFRDFSSFNYYLDHYALTGEDRFQRISFRGDESLESLDSTVRLVKDWSLYNLTALVRYTDDFSSPSNDATLQKYPEVTMTGFRQPVFGSPLQLELTAGYDYFFRQEGQRGHLWEMQPTLYLPMNMGRYAQITPQAGWRQSVWQRSDSLQNGGDRYGDREVIQLGTLASTEIHRVYDVGGPAVEKIRHGIKPEITYTFIPDPSQDYAPDFLQRIPGQHGITYALTNTLLARMRGADGNVGYRELMRFKVSQTYDILEARKDVTVPGVERHPFSDVELELDLSPLQYIALSSRNSFSVKSGNWTRNNYDLTLSDNRGDSVTAGYRYTRDVLEEINLMLRSSLTSSFDAIYLLRRNQRDGRTIESTYGIKYRKQCWNVEVSLSDREDDRTIMVALSLYGIGTGGW